jgi:hypothetical protein
MSDLRGILSYLDYYQSSIEYSWHTEFFEENVVVYRRIPGNRELCWLYLSKIGEVIVWPGFTSTSRDRDYVLKTFITNEDSVLFEIEVHPGDSSARFERQSRYEHEREILIPDRRHSKLSQLMTLMFLFLCDEGIPLACCGFRL